MNFLSKTIILSLCLMSSATHPMRSNLPKIAKTVCALQARTATHISWLHGNSYECANALEQKGFKLIEDRQYKKGIAMLALAKQYEEDDLFKRNPRRDEAIRYILEGKFGLAKTALEKGNNQFNEEEELATEKTSSQTHDCNKIDPEILYKAHKNIGPNPYLQEAEIVTKKGDLLTGMHYLRLGYHEALQESIKKELDKAKK